MVSFSPTNVIRPPSLKGDIRYNYVTTNPQVYVNVRVVVLARNNKIYPQYVGKGQNVIDESHFSM